MPSCVDDFPNYIKPPLVRGFSIATFIDDTRGYDRRLAGYCVHISSFMCPFYSG